MLVSDGHYRNQWGEGGWGRGQAGLSERYNLESKRKRQTVVVKDCSRRFRSSAPGRPEYRQKLLTPAFCVVVVSRFSLPSTPHHGSFGGRALRYTQGPLHSSYSQGRAGSRHMGDKPWHSQLLHSQLTSTHGRASGKV